MASKELNLRDIYEYFIENSGKVKNRDAVRYFKNYLTDPACKDENRKKFKEYINKLAHTKAEGDEKVLILKTKYQNSLDTPASPLSTSTSSLNMTAPQYDPRNAIGIPTSPLNTHESTTNTAFSTPPRLPPPYRNPPPVPSPSPSLDSISISSNSTLDERPQAPPRRRGNLEDQRSNSQSNLLENGGNYMEVESISREREELSNFRQDGDNNMKEHEEEKEVLSVKERTQKFNRMASVEDELSPRGPKSAEKDRSKNWGTEEIDTSTLPPLEPKKCQEWYVTASRGDYQELLKLARNEPRLVNRKDPFSTVLHWGAKHGNAEIVKVFAGRYKVDVNSLTGYTALHISAQFGHKHIFKLLIEVYKADTKIRDYSGRTAEFYLLSKEKKENNAVTLRKIKGRKKQSEIIQQHQEALLIPVIAHSDNSTDEDEIAAEDIVIEGVAQLGAHGNEAIVEEQLNEQDFIIPEDNFMDEFEPIPEEIIQQHQEALLIPVIAHSDNSTDEDEIAAEDIVIGGVAQLGAHGNEAIVEEQLNEQDFIIPEDNFMDEFEPIPEGRGTSPTSSEKPPLSNTD